MSITSEIKASCNRDNLAMIIGLAFLWSYLRTSSYLNAWLASVPAMMHFGSPSLFDDIYSLSLLAAFLVIFFLGIARVSVLKCRSLLWLMTVLDIASFLALTLPIARMRGIFVPMLFCSLVAAALSLAYFFVAWGVRSSQVQAGRAVLNVLISYLLFRLLLPILTILGIEMSYLGPFIVPAMLLLSPPERKDESVVTSGTFKNVPWGLFLGSVIFVYLSTYLVDGIHPADDINVLIVSAISLPVTALFFVLYEHDSFSWDVLVLTALCLFVLLCASLLLIYLYVPTYNVLYAIKHSFDFYLWILCLYTVSKKHVSPTFMFALYGFFIVGFSHVLAFNFTYQMGMLYSISHQSAFASSAAILLFVIVTIMAVVVTRRYLRWSSNPPVKQKEDLDRDKCLVAAKKGGLTEREAQVIMLVYHGFTAKRVGEELFLSESTVKGHLMHAYKKLNIHSKQELIDLVDTY